MFTKENVAKQLNRVETDKSPEVDGLYLKFLNEVS